MELVRFTHEMFDVVRHSKVHLVGRSESYWDELCDSFDIFPSIASAFDNAKRRQGDCSFRGKKIGVFGFDFLEKLSSDAILIITDDYYREIYEQLQTIQSVRNRFQRIYFYPNQETQYDLAYREKYQDAPLRDIILFRSGPHASGYVPGLDFADNARALFEYMLREGFDEKYELVWLVHDPMEYESRYADYPKVRFLPYGGAAFEDKALRDRYYEALCLAKYIFFTDAYGFARNARQDQIRVQLWHGCGIKRRVYFSPCEKRYEYTTVISNMYAELHAKDYGLHPEQMLVTGYPKDDWLFHPIKDWQDRLHIPKASKVIFWLPTFRTTGAAGLENLNEEAAFGETGLPIVHSMEMMEQLNNLLMEKDMLLLVKLHPFQKRNAVCQCALSHILFLENEDLRREDVQINQILGHADALISDYSSAAIDYTLLDRPIAFTLDDYETYGDSRGFNWPNVRDYLPGEELFTFTDFQRFIAEVAEGEDSGCEKRRKLRQKFHAYFDDGSAARVTTALGIRM
ncbi:MAG: CDP-glycerol glycerophosphotransferase family protein [Schwartzia sp.]|nr:CDP-glycerol glycerophosphotransferase family protein [Schwartzia sp. (in: firmicutes)]